MRLHWEIADEDVKQLRAFMARWQSDAFVKHRIQKNVVGPKPAFSRERFWQEMIACLLTTQQRSGPDSPVSRLIGAEPFPLPYPACSSSKHAKALVLNVLKKSGGIRRSTTIADEVAENLRRLEQGLWAEVEEAWGCLLESDSALPERETARFIDANLRGFGPKQARNLLQGLGLTKYEIPLDSRVGKWLKEYSLGCSPLSRPKDARVKIVSQSDGCWNGRSP